MYKLSQTIFTPPPLTARFVLTPQQENDFSLARLSQRLQTRLNLSDNDTQDLEGHLNRHVGEASTFTEKAALCHFLTQIFYHLSQDDISDAQKFSMANALIIDIDKCTNGFYNRAAGLFQSLAHAETLEGWLYNIRVDLVEQTARQATSDVHTHNRYFFVAAQRFGVRPIVTNDAYQGRLTDTAINRDLSFNFSVAHQPLQIINRLATRLEEELLAMGLRTLIDRRQYDQAIIDGVVEKIENFLQPASLVVTDIIAFSDGDDEDLQAHPTHLHVNQIKKLIYQRLVRNGLLIPEAPDVDALMTALFDLSVSHDNLRAMGARLIATEPGLFYDLIAFLSFKPDAEKLSIIEHAVTHLNPIQIIICMAITSGYFQDFSLIAERFKTQILPEFLTGAAWGPDSLQKYCGKKSLYQFCLKMILHFEQYDFLMSRSVSGQTILGVLAAFPTTLDYCLPLICQIPQPYLELLMTSATIGQRNWLMFAILEQRHPVFAIQQLSHFIQPETLRTMLDDFFEAAIQLDLDIPTHGLYIRQWVELCHRVGLMQNIHDYRFRNGRTLLHRACIYNQIPLARCLIENSMNIEVVDADGYTALHFSAKQGHLDMTRLLLTSGANIEAKTQAGYTPLHIAAIVNRLDIATLLIEQAANLEAIDKHQLTALHIAALNGHLDMTRLLITHGANLHTKNQEGQKGFHLAAARNHIEIVDLFLQQGLSIDMMDTQQPPILHYAAHHGHIEMVQWLISKGANILAISNMGETALHFAAAQGDIDITQYLLNNGANIHATNTNGETPLHFAAENNHIDVIQLLLQNGARIDNGNKKQLTILHLAVTKNLIETVRWLINNGANIHAKTQTGKTALHLAVENNYIDIVKFLIEKGGNIDDIDQEHYSPLHDTVSKGHIEMAQYLIHNRANIHKITKKGHTALHFATRFNQFEIANLLIQNGARIEEIDQQKNTALHLAAEFAHIQMAQLLLKLGANLNAKTIEGLTPLHLAASANNIQIADLLVKHGANVNDMDLQQNTPLHFAAYHNRIEMALWLIAHRANLGAQGYMGSPLHYAARNGHITMVECLIKNQANIHAKNLTGETALHFAAMANQPKIAELLLKNGALINDTNSAQMTPLHFAAKHGHRLLMKILTEQYHADIHAKNNQGQTVLHLAILSNHLEIVVFLLAHKTLINVPDALQNTALHLTALSNYLEMTQWLVEQGHGNLHAKNNLGFTPLEVARATGHTQVAERLQFYLDAQTKPQTSALGLFVQAAQNRCRKRDTDDALAPPLKRH